MSSSCKCKEQVGLTDLCDRDVLVEAPEVCEMTQTKSGREERMPRMELVEAVLTFSTGRKIFRSL